MFFLSPAKLLVVFVVVMIVVGPDRLPQVARQVGAALQSLRHLHGRVESDLRESIPNLPSSREIAHYARSPSALISKLIELPDEDAPSGGLDGVAPVDRDALVPDPAAAAADVIDTGPPLPDADWPADHAAPVAGVAPRAGERAGAFTPLSSPRVNGNGSNGSGSSGAGSSGTASSDTASSGTGNGSRRPTHTGDGTPYADPNMN